MNGSVDNPPLRWLHLSDLHMGAPGRGLWWQVHQEFKKSLQEKMEQIGPPDLILMTGDLTWRGQAKEFVLVDQFLNELLSWLRGFNSNSNPVVIPVPGNHDLVRPQGMAALPYAVLKNWGQDDPDIAQIQKTLWGEKDASFFVPLFANYQHWLQRTILPQLARAGVSWQQSHFPGDLLVRLAWPDRSPLVVVGLNSTWLACRDDAKGRLEIATEQLLALLSAGTGGENPLQMLDGQPSLLLMHHPLDWFSDKGKKQFLETLYPPDRFLASLCGHRHTNYTLNVVVSGGKSRCYIQSSSLFGVEHLGSSRETRSMGYTWGEVKVNGQIRIWPLQRVLIGGGEALFLHDNSFGQESPQGKGIVIRAPESRQTKKHKKSFFSMNMTLGGKKGKLATSSSPIRAEAIETNETDIPVLIAHAKGEEPLAEELGKRLMLYGITAAHRGTVFAGNSFIAEASAALNAGFPVVLCGTVRAAGTAWCRKLVRSASETGNAIYPILMEEEADFSGLLPADIKFFTYLLNPDRAIDELAQILKRRHRRPSQIRTVDEESELAVYCSWALKKHGNVALIGVGGADLTMDLAKIYVPLRISQRSMLAEMEQRKPRPGEAPTQQNDEDVKLADVFTIGEKRHIALFGDPGAGKSTALRKLLHHCLVDGPTVLGLEERILPLFLRLRRFSTPFLTQPLSAFLQNEIDVDSGYNLPSGLGEILWRRGGLLLLFDGLDEIADQDLRAKVAYKLENALLDGRSRKIYAAISCRYAGYGGHVRLGGSFLHLEVRPLDDDQAGDFVHLWFQEAHRCLPKGNSIQAEQEASKLLRNLKDPPYATQHQQIKVLVNNPLLLTLLCVVLLQKHEIPRRRVEFYKQCLDVLLYRWRYLLEEDAPPLTLELALSVLRKMAWQMHSTGRQYDLTEQEFIALSNEVLDRQGASRSLKDGGLRWFHVTCGVLEEYSPKCYGFMHPGFQEYLAACHVASQRQTLMVDLVARRGEKGWKEVILLLAGLEDSDLFVQLVEAILPSIRQAEGAALLQDVLIEASIVDLAPFESRLLKGEPEEQAALLRLLQGRSNVRLREIAEQLAEESDSQEVQILASRFLRPRVFISHRKNDSALAKQLAQDLSAAGHDVWFDEWKIDVGNSIVEKINQGIERGGYLLICYSSSTVDSPWMNREWMSTLAGQLNGVSVKIIPLYLTGKSGPAILADIKAADLMEDWSSGIAALLRAIK